jgi:DNA gyrase subunit A
VGGIKLKKGDKVVYAALVDPAGVLITLSTHGFAKYSAMNDYPCQGRNGGGIVTHKLTDRTGPLCSALLTVAGLENETLLAVTRKGVPKLVAFSDIPAMGRGVQGKSVMETTPNDAVVLLQRLLATTQTPPIEPINPDGAPLSGEAAVGAAPARESEAAKLPARVTTSASKVAIKPKAAATATKPAAPPLDKARSGANGPSSVKNEKSAPSVKTEKSNGKPVPPPLQGGKAGAGQKAPSSAGKATPDAATPSKPGNASQKASSPAGKVTPEKGKVKPAAVVAKPTANRQADQERIPKPGKTPAPVPLSAKPKPGTAAAPAKGEQGPAKPPARATTDSSAVPEPVTQAHLFNVEPTAAPPVRDAKANKVQAVVSVPAGQVRKKNK